MGIKENKYPCPIFPPVKERERLWAWRTSRTFVTPLFVSMEHRSNPVLFLFTRHPPCLAFYFQKSIYNKLIT